ncbi:hypothetical protein UlMin_013037 [Ulmus minor]
MAATQKTTPFSLEKKDVELVKPSKPTPSDLLSFSTQDNDINLQTLTPTIFVYQKRIINSSENGHDHHDLTPNFDARQDPALLIKKALSDVLVYYYPLAGRLRRNSQGKLELTCNANGVPLLVATATCHLSSLRYLEGIDFQIASQFIFDSPPLDDDGEYPLVLQVTKFSCGGFAIGFCMSHSVCDGSGAAQFFRAMAELSKGKMEPTVKPIWERERLLGKITDNPLELFVNKTPLATSPYLPTSDILHECFYVSGESIKRLKDSLVKESEVGDQDHGRTSFTTIEVLGAFIWRARFRALNLNKDGKTCFFLTTGIRKLLNPPLPEGYYGNAFASTLVELIGSDLNEEPLSKTVKLIKKSKQDVLIEGYFEKVIDTMETWISVQNTKAEASGATMVLTDWRNLELLEDLGFGWKAVNIVPMPWDMFGFVDLCFLLPPPTLDPSTKGGVRVLVSLPRPAMAKFRQEMDALHKIEAMVSCSR